MNKKCVIVSGGLIDFPFALKEIEKIKPKVIIGVDHGLTFLYENNIVPTYIVGDFDSIDQGIIEYYKKNTNIPIREFNPIKDASDTEIAVKLAIEIGVDEIWILGGTGTRLDHVMANIQMLKNALDAKIQAYILDPWNRISLVRKEVTLHKETAYGTYFSVFPLGGILEDFTIEGAKYPLHSYTLSPYDSRCVSNEFLEDKVKITFPEGTLILMETRDGIKNDE